MTAAYQQIIKLFAEGQVDFKAVATRLAQQEPEMFLCMVDAEANEPWMREAMAHMRENHKVECIKVIRTRTGLGLKEAKEIADHLQNFVSRERGSIVRAYGDATELHGKDALLYTQLIRN
jgi:ribosomal protein L7/L12